MPDDDITKLKVDTSEMKSDINNIKDNIETIEEYIKEDREWKQTKEKEDKKWRDNFFEKIDDRFVHKTRFETLQKVVYGSIGVILTLIGGTIAFTIEIILEYNLL